MNTTHFNNHIFEINLPGPEFIAPGFNLAGDKNGHTLAHHIRSDHNRIKPDLIRSTRLSPLDPAPITQCQKLFGTINNLPTPTDTTINPNEPLPPRQRTVMLIF
jgi:hypothetical protein